MQVWEVVHKGLGYLTLGLGALTIYLGLVRTKVRACSLCTACWLVACAHIDSEHRCDTEESFGMSTGHVRRALMSVTMFVITPTANDTYLGRRVVP
jgi:hypothetical protein